MNNELLHRIKATAYSVDIAAQCGLYPSWLRQVKDVLDECAKEVERLSSRADVNTGSQYEELVLKKMDTIIDALYKLENKPRETNL